MFKILKMKGNPMRKVHQLASPNAMVLNILIKGSMKENKKKEKLEERRGKGDVSICSWKEPGKSL